ncbi:MAG TPA: ADOP family duplicated permease [Longimicrobiales bacterium]|nr:ADOP family duplicated permease [Longimicrobiales bacterium]
MPHSPTHDLRLALRSLRKSPGFAVAVVLSVAVGIGACVSVFAAIDAARFRPLPYDDPDRLVWVYGTAVGDEVPAYAIGEDVFRDWSARPLRSIESLALEGGTEALLRGGAEPVSTTVGLVSGGYFRVAGARPRLGRTLLPDDDAPGAGPAAVLSYPFWVRRFGADRAVLGRTLRLGGTTATVVGVMPPGMRLPGDVVVPLSAASRDLTPASTSILARLRPGATLAQAKAELRQLARTSALADSAGREPRSATAYSIPEMARRISSSELWLLLGAVALVFLIAIGNLANLFLVRAQSRARDLAVRAALGARRRDLVRQLVVESLALTLPGGALGAVLAVWGKALAGRFVPPEVAATITIDARALAVAAALAVLVGVVVGVAPLGQLRRLEVRGALQEGAASLAGSRRQRLERNALIAAQVALALVLLGGAGVLARSYLNLRRLDVGYDADRVVLATMKYRSTPHAASEQQRILGDAVLERLRGRPEVAAAALWRKRMWEYGRRIETVFALEGRPVPTEMWSMPLGLFEVSPDYFATIGIPIVRGRGFSPADGASAPGVVVVSEQAARRWWPGEDPVGKRLRLGGAGSTAPWLTVVGVARVEQTIDEGGRQQAGVGHIFPLIFRPLAQSGEIEGWAERCLGCRGIVVGARAAGDPDRVVPVLREAVAGVAPDVPVDWIGTLLSFQLGERMTGGRLAFSARLLGVFAGAGGLLALLGVFGIVADAVSRRTRELGVRIALGARPVHVIARVMAEGAGIAVAGIVVGLACTVAAQGALDRVFYHGGRSWYLVGTSGRDPLVLAAASGAFLLTAALAALLAARRAARIEPMAALRAE